MLAGQSSFDDINDVCSPIPAINLGCGESDDSDTAIGINAAYKITDNWGIELGYVDLGEFSTEITTSFGSTVLTADASVAYLSGTATLPLSDTFSLTGRVGVYTASGDVSSSGIFASSVDIEDDTSATFGASLDYRFTEKFSVQLRYDDFDGIDLAGVGLNYHF